MTFYESDYDYESCKFCGSPLTSAIELDTGECDLCVEDDFYEEGDDYEEYIYD